MKRVCMNHLCLVWIVFCLCVSGCASFPRHRIPQIGELPPPTDKHDAVSASYTFSSGYDLGFGRNKYAQNIQKTLEEEFVSVLNESGYCTILQSGQEDGIHIEADLLNYGSGIEAGVAGFISGFTFCTIPCWATDNYNLTVKVTTSEGKQHEYVFDDAMTTVIWLPLIVATPFKFPSTIGAKVRKNMYKNLIRRMQEDGLLPSPGTVLQSSRLVLTFKVAPTA